LYALSQTFLGALGTWNFPFTRFSDLVVRSDLTGIGDVSVVAAVLGLDANLPDVKGEKFLSAVSVGRSVLGLDAKSPDVKGETPSSVPIDISSGCCHFGVTAAMQTLTLSCCMGESR